MSLLDEIKGDAAVFLDDFGVTAILDSKLDGFKEITVIFDPENPVIDPDTGEINNIVPAAMASSEDVANVRQKDTLEIDGSTYEVKKILPDGAGLTELILGKK